MNQVIKFGTDGWRGVIGEDFIFANVRRVAVAAARYLRTEGAANRGLIVGYDTRFLSLESARVAAQVLAAEGIPVLIADRATPTPAVSYAVVARKAAGALMITASHNPYRWNGIKFKAAYGGSAAPAMVKRIEEYLRQAEPAAGPSARSEARIETADLAAPYLQRIRQLVSLDRIRASELSFVIDPMYGAARGLIARLFEKAGIRFQEIHGEHNPLFPGLNPEPIEPHVEDLRQAVISGSYYAGFATDGDADRVGAIDRSGRFIDSHKIFSILLKHLVEDQGRRGEVVRTFSTTQMIDHIARKHGLPLHVTPIGFKYVCELMLTRDILIGGEESGGIGIKGHLPERDGILNSLLLAEVMAQKGRTLGELVQDLNDEYGPHFYGRVDLEIERDAIDRMMRLLARRGIRRVAGQTVS
ncbi:MAG TPA: phosphoglucomutase/phosphomannomutase family protein, partial [Terriglobia bacterium]|nr:phosphoglucomutase/phosphomannomutase family protein [Terriglobia bacterium]